MHCSDWQNPVATLRSNNQCEMAAVSLSSLYDLPGYPNRQGDIRELSESSELQLALTRPEC
ncbi:hypothetical protein CBM2605_A60068 [Cupriavidus neocaledonicus]|uniref:Uncharacterized protein n=1 Tax=Cupriavidus neocaledonicus TaxID=1040979 RepID=A0ABY1V2X4_9BURK|nr:hypothetical protein CBM2605_A60068 [Cupriavidus neocaledonicus]